jgi:type IV pilus assembly protein PilE
MELRAGAAGFTLVELMVVIVIATLLLSIAIPSYMSQVRQSRRTEAKTALLDLAGREESFFSTNGSVYTNAASDLGYRPWAAGNSPSGYYTIAVACIAAQGVALGCDPNANRPNGPAFYLTATPVAGSSQASDTQCASFSVDSLGNQFAADSTGANTTAQCWSQ